MAESGRREVEMFVNVKVKVNEGGLGYEVTIG